MTREQAKACLQSIPGIPPEKMNKLLKDSSIILKVAELWRGKILSSSKDVSHSFKAWKVYMALIALANIDSIAIPEEIPEWGELAETDLPSEWLLPEESQVA